MLNIFALTTLVWAVGLPHSQPSLTGLAKPPVEVWYGPAEIRFSIPNVSDPYDPGKTDVQVQFEGPGRIETRLAFFNGKEWCARLLAPVPGEYTPHIILNGKELEAKPQPIQVTTKNPLSFVRLDEAFGGFCLGDGSRYWPVGHDLAWSNGQQLLQDQMPQMHSAGLNWARIWNTYWDGRCPYWSTSKKLAPYEIDQSAMEKWDTIVRTAEQYDIRFQWVLHHHGQVSTQVNPNWQDHPWNVKNGGFLKTAEDFFTDPEAKRRTKAMLRYLVARYADSPSIMAWELFNEVQFSDAARNKHWDTVGTWHDEMAKYLKEIDPYHHLVTTSSEQSAPIWNSTDYRQDHGYPASLEALLLSSKGSDKQPYFFGEVGLGGSNATPESEKTAIRDGIWSGLLAGHAGAGEYWYWDRIAGMKLYPEFERATKILGMIDYLKQVPMKPASIKINSALGGTLAVSPGRGWAKSEKQEFLWPAEADSASMGLLSTFLQGSNHPDMGQPELKISFNAPKAGTFGVGLGDVSAGGASLRITLDGSEAFNQSYAPNSHVNKTISIPFTAGRHTLVLHNGGADWINVNRFEATGLAPAVTGEAATSLHMVVMRLHSQSKTSAFSIKGLDFPDTDIVHVRIYDLDTGAAYDEDSKVANGVLSGFPLHGSDVIVSFRR
jgi:hypothetical protein